MWEMIIVSLNFKILESLLLRWSGRIEILFILWSTRLIELALVLPVATNTVERVLSARKILDTYLQQDAGWGMSGWMIAWWFTSRRPYLGTQTTKLFCNVIKICKDVGFSCHPFLPQQKVVKMSTIKVHIFNFIYFTEILMLV